MFFSFITYLFYFSRFIDLYRGRLEEDNCEGDIDAMVKALPACRASDLGGGRGKSRTKNFKKSKNTQRSEVSSTFNFNKNKKVIIYFITKNKKVIII